MRDDAAPAEVTFGALAAQPTPDRKGPPSYTDGRCANAAPQWNRAAATSTGTYCHGGGIWLSSDPVAGTVRAPSWTGSSGQVFCGSCHGVPPTTHGPMVLTQCAGCHPSVDAAGVPIVLGTTSKHMDGVVDVTFE